MEFSFFPLAFVLVSVYQGPTDEKILTSNTKIMYKDINKKTHSNPRSHQYLKSTAKCK